MKSLIKKLFLQNWPRKLLSVILAIFIWFVVNKSLTTTKTINNVPVKIENIPPGKTAEGLQSNGTLNRKVNLVVSGNKNFLNDLGVNDLFIAIDASSSDGEWIATVTKKNLKSSNPDLNIAHNINRVIPLNFIVKLSKLVSEKIPITITKPIGDSPAGYQFVDIWPYHLSLTVSGPEETVKNLKSKGLHLTFNLNDITRTKLEELQGTSSKTHTDIVSYYIPNTLKEIFIPSLCPTPIAINDPDARFLRIDFLRCETLKLSSPVPVSLYFPPSVLSVITPSKLTLLNNKLIESKNGIKLITQPLYVKGVSQLFLDVIKDMLEIAIIVNPSNEGKLEWNTQFINSRILEEKYLQYVKSDATEDELRDLQPYLRDNYLRNRFRNYMNRLKLYASEKEKFKFEPMIKGNYITVADNPQNEKE